MSQGSNYFGQCGIDSSAQQSTTPALVVGPKTWTMVTIGVLHTCAITTGNQAYCWVRRAGGRLRFSVATRMHHPQPKCALY